MGIRRVLIGRLKTGLTGWGLEERKEILDRSFLPEKRKIMTLTKIRANLCELFFYRHSVTFRHFWGILGTGGDGTVTK